MALVLEVISMPYNKFSLRKATQDFDLTLVEGKYIIRFLQRTPFLEC